VFREKGEKNMKHKPIFQLLQRAHKMAISAGLSLALLAAILPQPVQAATCRAYYTVQKGDTTPYISHTFNLKWRDIAGVNDMDPGDKLTVGQRLCIPPESASTKEESSTTSSGNKTKVRVPETDSKAVVLVSISGGRIGLTTKSFSVNHTYLVKTRDATTNVGGWYKIEVINVKKSKTQNFNFNVPKDLRSTTTLSVCLKDIYTDELICRQSINP
jgi:LysM repeat protein